MLPTIVLVVFLVIMALIFLGWGGDLPKKRKRAIEAMAKLLEAQVQDLEGYENSYQIPFTHKAHEFIYEDLEDKGFQGKVFRKGMLKLKIGVNLTIGFSERDAGTIRDNAGSLAELRNPWMQNVGKLIVPQSLSRFNIFTNNIDLVTALFADESILKIFDNFRNMDSRGHPVMSIEIFDGILVLKFHDLGGLKPSLFTLYNNPSAIEEHLEKLIMLAEKIEAVNKKLEADKQ